MEKGHGSTSTTISKSTATTTVSPISWSNNQSRSASPPPPSKSYSKTDGSTSHPRSYRKGGFTTLKEHMPKAHQQYLEWTPSRIIRWAAQIGPQHRKTGHPHPGNTNPIPNRVSAPAWASSAWENNTPKNASKPPAPMPFPSTASSTKVFNPS